MELGTPRALMRALGEPLGSIPAIHVAGSNGKGSIVEMVTRILMASGLRVGTYTSPHLIRLTERVRVNGRELDPGDLAENLDKVRSVCGTLRTPRHPSFFECITAAAFLAFEKADLDIVVAETGLGGRLDATRFLPWTLVQAFGPTGLEHQDRLGPTLGRIAGEKAAIMMAGLPAVSAPQPPGAREVFRRRARETRSLYYEGGESFGPVRVRVGLAGSRFGLSLPREAGIPHGGTFFTPMPGEHQAWNAAVAVFVAALALRGLGRRPGPRAFRRGLALARVPGRFQILPGKPRWVLDTGCNPAALETVVKTFRRSHPGEEPVLLAGFLRDKDIKGSAAVLSRLSRRAVAVAPPIPDRARTAAETASALRARGIRTLEAPTVEAGLVLAAEIAGHKGIVLVTGSLFLVGRVLALRG